MRDVATQRKLKYAKIERDNMFLFGLLLSFFEDEKESVNVTLAGYVSKVIISLMNIAKNKQREIQVRYKEKIDCYYFINYPYVVLPKGRL